MGRHAGWIAAAGGLAADQAGDPPHIILFPEIAFNREKFLKKVRSTVKKNGYCVIVASEGAQYKDGTFIADAGTTDAFGHKQLGGVAPTLAAMIKDELGYKYHWALADYLQRSARHIGQATGGGNPAGVAAHDFDNKHLGGGVAHGGHIEAGLLGGHSHVFGHRAKTGAVVGQRQVVIDGFGNMNGLDGIAQILGETRDLQTGVGGIAATVIEEVTDIVSLEQVLSAPAATSLKTLPTTRANTSV